MVTRTAHLDYRVTGAEQSRARVVSLADALERQKRQAAQAAPAIRRAGQDTVVLGAVSQSATARIASLTNTLGPLGAGLGSVARTAPLAAQGLFRYAAGVERINVLSRGLNTAVLGGAAAFTVAGVAAAAYFDDVIRGADAYAAMQARVRIFTEGTVGQAQALRDVYQTARDARTSVQALVTLYTRLAPAVRDAGRAQADAMRITALVAKSNLIGGGGVREAEAGTIQFSQAIGSGVLRGDEFRSLMESQPMLMRYIARNLQVGDRNGVAFSQLRALAEQGELTANRIMNALLAAEQQIEADFANAPRTAAQGWQVLQDAITRTVGQLSMSAGLQSGVVQWLGDLTDRLDRFRERALLDPNALDPVKEIGRTLSGALAAIGNLGEGALEHFDAIVSAGTLIVSLKLGEVFASWFSRGAELARRMSANMAELRANARFAIGATLDPTAATAASALRQSAVAADLRATELRAAAEIRLAQAQVMRKAATDASAQADLVALQHGRNSAAATAAQADASMLNTQAKRAETAAKTAVAQATSAEAAARARATAATQAETVATRSVTGAMAAKHVAMRAGVGLYNLLGGAIGVATIAIGGLIWALVEAERARRREIDALRESMVVSEQMRAIVDAMTAATWAQIPALQERTARLYEQARAARQAAEAERDRARAMQTRLDEAAPTAGAGTPMAGIGGLQFGLMALVAGRRADDLEAVVRAARQDEWRQRQQVDRSRLVAFANEANTIAAQLARGRDPAGRELTADAISRLQARQADLFALGQRLVDAYERVLAQQDQAIAQAEGQERARLVAGREIYASLFDAAASVVSSTLPSDASPAAATASTGGGGRPRGRQPSLDRDIRRTLEALTQQTYRPIAGGPRFSFADGQVLDAETNGVFRARSEDEARAAQQYADAITAINTATAEEIALTGQSREALRDAAEARLRDAVATSQATQATERWAEITAEMNGESRAAARAERQVIDLRRQGADITEEAAEAYVAYARAVDQARRASQALSAVQPITREAFETVMAGARMPTDARGQVDVRAAADQLAAFRADVIREARRRTEEETRREAESEGWAEVDFRRRLAERIAAVEVAVEIETLERLRELRRQALEEEVRYIEDRIERVAESLDRAFQNLLQSGQFGEFGRAVAGDFLQMFYEEMISNPLRHAIREAIRGMLTPSAPGGGGGLGGFFQAILGSIGIRGAGRAGGAPWGGAPIPGTGNGGFRIGNFAGGGLIRGPGGPRSDSILALVDGRSPIGVSNGEFIVNAEATRRHLNLLTAINEDRVPGFAAGGLVGRPGQPAAPGAVSVTYAPVYHVVGVGEQIEALKAEIARDRAEAPGVILKTLREAKTRRMG